MTIFRIDTDVLNNAYNKLTSVEEKGGGCPTSHRQPSLENITHYVADSIRVIKENDGIFPDPPKDHGSQHTVDEIIKSLAVGLVISAYNRKCSEYEAEKFWPLFEILVSKVDGGQDAVLNSINLSSDGFKAITVDRDDEYTTEGFPELPDATVFAHEKHMHQVCNALLSAEHRAQEANIRLGQERIQAANDATTNEGMSAAFEALTLPDVNYNVVVAPTSPLCTKLNAGRMQAFLSLVEKAAKLGNYSLIYDAKKYFTEELKKMGAFGILSDYPQAIDVAQMALRNVANENPTRAIGVFDLFVAEARDMLKNRAGLSEFSEHLGSIGVFVLECLPTSSHAKAKIVNLRDGLEGTQNSLYKGAVSALVRKLG